jgi:hypothetical protein
VEAQQVHRGLDHGRTIRAARHGFQGNAGPAAAAPPGAGAHAGPALALYVVGCFVAAALAAPAVYRGVAAAAEYVPALEPLTRHPVYRYLHRLLLVFGVLGLPALLRALGMRSWRDVGLGRPWAHRRAVARGALLGAATVIAMAAVPLAVGAREFKDGVTAGQLAAAALAALVAAAGGGAARGAALPRRGGRRAAAVARTGRGRAGGGARAEQRLLRPRPLLHPPRAPGARGVALGVRPAGRHARRLRRPRDAGAAVPHPVRGGRRAGRAGAADGRAVGERGRARGAVFVLQLYGRLVAAPPASAPGSAAADAAARWLWGSGRLVDGWVALGTVGAAALAGAAALRRRDRRRAAGPALAVVRGGCA